MADAPLYARRDDGRWYPGWASDLSSDPVEVTWEDETTTEVPQRVITLESDPAEGEGFAIGIAVDVSVNDEWHPAAITGRFGRVWHVERTDGKLLTVHASSLRLPETPRVPKMRVLVRQEGYWDEGKADASQVDADEVQVVRYGGEVETFGRADVVFASEPFDDQDGTLTVGADVLAEIDGAWREATIEGRCGRLWDVLVEGGMPVFLPGERLKTR